MEYRILGRTGLNVSVMGLGGGGHSRLGMSQGRSEAESLGIIQTALNEGVNLIDTAEAYGTESLIGTAIKPYDRSKLVLSTKKLTNDLSAAAIRTSVDKSLMNLGTDYLDIYHLHGVSAQNYARVCEEALPVLDALKQQGKIRFLGITERFERDTNHEMLTSAIEDDHFDVMMIGFNLINQTASRGVFEMTQQRDIGVLIMFAVRRALSDARRLAELLAGLRDNGQVDESVNGLDFLVHDQAAVSIPDAGYRFCKYEPGVHVVLSGTSNLDHLNENIRSLGRGPLPDHDLSKLKQMFARVDSVSGS